MAGQHPHLRMQNTLPDEEDDINTVPLRMQTHWYASEDANLSHQQRLHSSHFTPRCQYNAASAEDNNLMKYISSGVTFASLVVENVLCHPFQVLRRQCQVHHMSHKYHLLPITLIPTVYHLHQHQGLTTLWKGLGSVLLVSGITVGVEDLISKITPWPKDIAWSSSLKQFFQHTLLKCVSLAIVTPFYSASFVETVQSEIASEKPGVFDVFKEGLMRIVNWNSGSKGRMIPIWSLIIPTVTLGLAKYLFTMMVRGACWRILHAKYKYQHEMNGALPKDLSRSVDIQNIKLTSSLVATIVSDVVFYPCETIVHRLHLQGTRTIVDNLDNGMSVLPILTNYTGATDCYESCLATEGTLGLYKGFGALILQYSMHILLIKTTYFIFTEVGSMFSKPKDPNLVRSDVSPPALTNLTTASKSYLLP